MDGVVWCEGILIFGTVNEDLGWAKGNAGNKAGTGVLGLRNFEREWRGEKTSFLFICESEMRKGKGKCQSIAYLPTYWPIHRFTSHCAPKTETPKSNHERNKKRHA